MAFRLEDWMRVVIGTRFPALTLWSGELRFGKARDWENAPIAGSEETVGARLERFVRDAAVGRRYLRVVGDGPSAVSSGSPSVTTWMRSTRSRRGPCGTRFRPPAWRAR